MMEISVEDVGPLYTLEDRHQINSDVAVFAWYHHRRRCNPSMPFRRNGVVDPVMGEAITLHKGAV